MRSEEHFERKARDYEEESPLSSISRILQNISNSIRHIVLSEVELAKSEMTREARKAGKTTAFYAVATVFVLFGAGFLLLAAVYGLQNVVSPWLAALIVGVGSVLIGGIAYLLGRRRARTIHLKPEQTIQSVKENLQWFRNRIG
jgi:hypothetical protein